MYVPLRDYSTQCRVLSTQIHFCFVSVLVLVFCICIFVILKGCFEKMLPVRKFLRQFCFASRLGLLNMYFISEIMLLVIVST